MSLYILFADLFDAAALSAVADDALEVAAPATIVASSTTVAEQAIDTVSELMVLVLALLPLIADIVERK